MMKLKKALYYLTAMLLLFLGKKLSSGAYVLLKNVAKR